MIGLAQRVSVNTLHLVVEKGAEVVDQYQCVPVAVAELLPARLQRFLEERSRLL